MKFELIATALSDGGKMSCSNQIGGFFLVATLLFPPSSSVNAEISSTAEAVYEWSRLEYEEEPGSHSNEDIRVRCLLQSNHFCLISRGQQIWISHLCARLFLIQKMRFAEPDPIQICRNCSLSLEPVFLV